MERIINQGIYISVTALFLLLIYLLAPILTPFLLGALIAYLADPLVRYLDRKKIPHILSVTSVFLMLLFIFICLILMLTPLIHTQIRALMNVIPESVTWAQNTLMPRLQEYVNITNLKTNLAANIPKTEIFTVVVQSSYTVVQWIVYLVLTPIVTFYFLRDWDTILDHVKNLLPKSIKPTVLRLAKQCDEVLGAFFRGQLIVMLCLCAIYGIGLTIVGLQVGLMIGVIGGLLSIVPYLGSSFVLVASILTSLVEFGTWESLIGVITVFLIGQALEGYILTPNLVGNRIGLHPVAVIFAIMAGGSLFGFFGVLLALPVAAVIMVLIRDLNGRYHNSKFYNRT